MTMDELCKLLWRAEGRVEAVKGLLRAQDPGAAEVQLETLAEELARALEQDRGHR